VPVMLDAASRNWRGFRRTWRIRRTPPLGGSARAPMGEVGRQINHCGLVKPRQTAASLLPSGSRT
jgi:hypothetical protein